MAAPLINEYRLLVSKYIDGTISVNELKLLETYYSLFRDEPEIIAQMDNDTVLELENRLFESIAQDIRQSKTQFIPIFRRAWFQIAASLLLVTAVVIFFRYKKNAQSPFVENTKSFVFQIAATADRFIVLPDNSHILLHAGSTLQISKQFNKGKYREVTLSGEAYFDVKHNSQQPFIIHTGKIITTVLGTAFDIKAYPGQNNIIVTVTRGRVKVEQGHTLLGILTPNKQLIANKDVFVHDNLTRLVVASQELKWTSEGMNFDNMPFGKLVEQLNKRYDVHIGFKNPALALCPITGSFNGTESIEKVLDLLSQTRGTTYTINNKNVIIDGPGCGN
jgi:ferric-dicitrate binding protein FerR (iron transport regulator)